MPASKQGGGYTLTFSKKNKDVKRILDEIKELEKEKITDYLCKCVRFYEENKNKIGPGSSGPIDENTIKSIVENQVKEILSNIDISQNKSSSLESNLDYVNIDDD